MTTATRPASAGKDRATSFAEPTTPPIDTSRQLPTSSDAQAPPRPH